MVKYRSLLQNVFANIMIRPISLKPKLAASILFFSLLPVIFLSKSYAFESDMHFDVTFELAVARGWEWDTAWELANVDISVDENVSTSPGVVPFSILARETGLDIIGPHQKLQNHLYHCFSQDDDTTNSERNELNSDVSASLGAWEDIIKNKITRYRQLTDQPERRFASNNALASLGGYLHCLEDAWSHSGFGGTRMGHAFNSGNDNPDAPWKRPLKTSAAIRSTDATLFNFLKLWGRESFALEEAELERLADALSHPYLKMLEEDNPEIRRLCDRLLAGVWVHQVLTRQHGLSRVPSEYIIDIPIPLGNEQKCHDVYKEILERFASDSKMIARKDPRYVLLIPTGFDTLRLGGPLKTSTFENLIFRVSQNSNKRLDPLQADLTRDGHFKRLDEIAQFNLILLSPSLVIKPSRLTNDLIYSIDAVILNEGPLASPPAKLRIGIYGFEETYALARPINKLDPGQNIYLPIQLKISGDRFGKQGISMQIGPLDEPASDKLNSKEQWIERRATDNIVYSSHLFTTHPGRFAPKDLLTIETVSVLLFITLPLVVLQRRPLFWKQCLTLQIGVLFIWIVAGYAFAFGPDIGNVVGSLGPELLARLLSDSAYPLYAPLLPEWLFAIYHGVVALFPVVLLWLLISERSKIFDPMYFIVLWHIVIYLPLVHWMWGQGFLFQLGSLDFAGGDVIATAMGFSAIAVLDVLGQQEPKGKVSTHDSPNSILYLIIIWIFILVSASFVSGVAPSTLESVGIGAMSGFIIWKLFSRIFKAEVLPMDALFGILAGVISLAAGAGYINLWAAMVTAGIGSGLAYFLIRRIGLRHRGSLADLFYVHAIAGVWGTVAVGFFADHNVNLETSDGLIFGGLIQFLAQLFCATWTVIFAYNISRMAGGSLMKAPTPAPEPTGTGGHAYVR